MIHKRKGAPPTKEARPVNEKQVPIGSLSGPSAANNSIFKSANTVHASVKCTGCGNHLGHDHDRRESLCANCLAWSLHRQAIAAAADALRRRTS
jgi:hypothetical protein